MIVAATSQKAIMVNATTPATTKRILSRALA